MKRKICVLFLLFLFGNQVLSAQNQEVAHPTEVRAAIDFGSGVIKIQVAVVDVIENRLIGKPLLSKHININLTEDVTANNGYISQEMEKKALAILAIFKENAQRAAKQAKYSEVRFSGIATAVFRKANNGGKVLQQFEEQLDIHFQILPQDEEGKLGFMTASILFPNTLSDNLIAWDSGNGSFQITVKEGTHFHTYRGPLGYGTVRVLLSKDVRKGAILQADESGNPVSKNEACELLKRINELLPPSPKWLEERLSSEKTVIAVFGDETSIFALVANAQAHLKGIKETVENAVIHESDIEKIIDKYQETTDAILDSEQIHRKTVTSALFLSAVMKHLGIKTIHYQRANGNTLGMLLNPAFWPVHETKVNALQS